MDKEDIKENGQILATIIYKHTIEKGLHFYTPDSWPLQVARHYRHQREEISLHKHLPVKIERNEPLQEVLYIEKGKVEISFYLEENKLLTTRILGSGDLILIQRGGHGFKFLEETEMIEIKQGPYDPKSTVRLEIKT